MAEIRTRDAFQEIFLTYKDIHEAAPNWPMQLIEDYLSMKRDLNLTADTADSIQNQADNNTHLISGLAGSTGKIEAINQKQAGKIVDIFHLLAGLDGGHGKLRAFANLLRRDVKNINQSIAGFTGDIGKLYALVNKLISLTRQQDVDVVTTYKQKKYDTGIFCDATGGNFTVTMEEASLVAMNRVVVKNETGGASTITIAASGSDTVEITSLSDTESVVFARRSYGWASV